MSDEVPARGTAHERLLVARFLNAVLADLADAGVDRIIDERRWKRLRHGHECHIAARAPRARAGARDPLFYADDVLTNRHGAARSIDHSVCARPGRARRWPDDR